MNAAEKAAAGSSLETFLMTSILEDCLAPGGFSVKYNSGDTKGCQTYWLTGNTVILGSHFQLNRELTVETEGQTFPGVHLKNSQKRHYMGT